MEYKNICAMLHYNVLEMYLRTIGICLLTFKRYVKKITLGSPHFSEGRGGGGVIKSAPPVHLKKNPSLTF